MSVWYNFTVEVEDGRVLAVRDPLILMYQTAPGLPRKPFTAVGDPGLFVDAVDEMDAYVRATRWLEENAYEKS